MEKLANISEAYLQKNLGGANMQISDLLERKMSLHQNISKFCKRQLRLSFVSILFVLGIQSIGIDILHLQHSLLSLVSVGMTVALTILMFVEFRFEQLGSIFELAQIIKRGAAIEEQFEELGNTFGLLIRNKGYFVHKPIFLSLLAAVVQYSLSILGALFIAFHKEHLMLFSLSAALSISLVSLLAYKQSRSLRHATDGGSV